MVGRTDAVGSRFALAAAVGLTSILAGTPVADGATPPMIRLGGGAGADATGDSPHTRASLVARSQAVPRGGNVEIALRLQLDPEWHVYWTNPGDAGLPPKLKWTVPDGVSVSTIDWPVPHYKKDEHGLITYLYEGDVVLPLTLTVDEAFAGDRIELVADASWLVCREACLPGKAQLALDLPVVDLDADAAPDSETAALFAAADLRSPAARASDAVRRAEHVPGRFGLVIDAKEVESLARGEVTARVMPVDPGLVDESAPHLATWRDDGGLRVTAPRDDDAAAPADARGFVELHGNDQTLIFRFGPA